MKIRSTVLALLFSILSLGAAPASAQGYQVTPLPAQKVVHGSMTYTVPPNSSVAFPTPDEIDLVQLGVGQTCFAAGSGVTLDTPTSLCARAQDSTIGIRQISTDTWIVFGDTQ